MFQKRYTFDPRSVTLLSHYVFADQVHSQGPEDKDKSLNWWVPGSASMPIMFVAPIVIAGAAVAGVVGAPAAAIHLADKDHRSAVR